MNNTRRIQVFITVASLLVLGIHLLWPTIVLDGTSLVLIAIAILPWLVPLLSSIELPGGLKLEFQELEKAKKRADKAGLLASSKRNGKKKTPKINKRTDSSYPFELVLKDDPNLALAGLRIEIEKRLISLAIANGVYKKYYGVPVLLGILYREHVFTEDEWRVLVELIHLLNSAVHGAIVDKRAVDWAADVGPRLLKNLDNKIVH